MQDNVIDEQQAFITLNMGGNTKDNNIQDKHLSNRRHSQYHNHHNFHIRSSYHNHYSFHICSSCHNRHIHKNCRIDNSYRYYHIELELIRYEFDYNSSNNRILTIDLIYDVDENDRNLTIDAC